LNNVKDTVNTYFAVLLITIVGAGAALVIVHVSYSNMLSVTGSEAQYAALERSILKQ